MEVINTGPASRNGNSSTGLAGSQGGCRYQGRQREGTNRRYGWQVCLQYTKEEGPVSLIHYNNML